MGLLQLQLGRVFDGDDAFVARDAGRHDIQQRGLAAARAARDEHVQAGPHQALDQLGHAGGECAHADEVVHAEGHHRKAANGQQGSVHGQGGDDRVHARAVGQPCVDHGAHFVHAPPDARDDAVDHPQQVRLVVELHIGVHDLAVPLGIDLERPVDQDVRDGGVGQQGLDGAQAQHFVLNGLDDEAALGFVERQFVGGNQLLGQRLEFGAQAIGGHALHALPVHERQNFLVDAGLDVVQSNPGRFGVRRVGCRRDGGEGRGQGPGVGRVRGLDERWAQQRGGVTGVFKLVAQVRVQTSLLLGAAGQAVG